MYFFGQPKRIYDKRKKRFYIFMKNCFYSPKRKRQTLSIFSNFYAIQQLLFKRKFSKTKNNVFLSWKRCSSQMVINARFNGQCRQISNTYRSQYHEINRMIGFQYSPFYLGKALKSSEQHFDIINGKFSIFLFFHFHHLDVGKLGGDFGLLE